MFEKTLRFRERTLRYSIAPSNSGWEVTEVRDEGDREVVTTTLHVSDWHRVERARRTITIKLDSLRRDGWFETN